MAQGAADNSEKEMWLDQSCILAIAMKGQLQKGRKKSLTTKKTTAMDLEHGLTTMYQKQCK